jgi:hypothetical protein
MVASSVINRPTCAIMKLNAITKICKYRGFHEGHHFILMAMEVHSAPGHDMDCFIKECARIFHNKQLGGHLSLSSCIQIFRQCVSIVFQRALASDIKKKIALVGDVCFRPLIIIRSHDLYTSNIRATMEEITSYQKKEMCFFWPSFFVSPAIVLATDLLLDSISKIEW